MYLLTLHDYGIPGRLCRYCRFNSQVSCADLQRERQTEHARLLTRALDEAARGGRLRRIELLSDEFEGYKWEWACRPETCPQTPDNLLKVFYASMRMPSPEVYTGDFVLSITKSSYMDMGSMELSVAKLMTRLNVYNLDIGRSFHGHSPDHLSRLLRAASGDDQGQGSRLKELLLESTGPRSLPFDKTCRFPRLRFLLLADITIDHVQPFVDFLDIHAPQLTVLVMSDIELVPQRPDKWNLILRTIRDKASNLTSFTCDITSCWHRATGCRPIMPMLGIEQPQAEADCRLMCDIEYDVDRRQLLKPSSEGGHGLTNTEADEILQKKWQHLLYTFSCQLGGRNSSGRRKYIRGNNPYWDTWADKIIAEYS
ncbi:hypothetical protein ABW21_db0201706 [Orbilia brochopaga]|nr:hypothetical protein ABW21_db0201706 [Drechslerella brochopaga]